jgi:hypothetical protein
LGGGNFMFQITNKFQEPNFRFQRGGVCSGFRVQGRGERGEGRGEMWGGGEARLNRPSLFELWHGTQKVARHGG